MLLTPVTVKVRQGGRLCLAQLAHRAASTSREQSTRMSGAKSNVDIHAREGEHAKVQGGHPKQKPQGARQGTDAGGGLLSTDPFWVRKAVPSDNNLTVFCPGFERCAFPCESDRLS